MRQSQSDFCKRSNESLAALLEEASTLPVGSGARNRLENRALEGSDITTMNQVATLVEAVARRAAMEMGESGDEDAGDAVFQNAQRVADALRRLGEVIETLA